MQVQSWDCMRMQQSHVFDSQYLPLLEIIVTHLACQLKVQIRYPLIISFSSFMSTLQL